MHELALAKAAKETILKNYGSKKKITVYIGEINHIDVDVFRQALLNELDELGVKVVFEQIPAKLKCNVCSREWFYRDAELTDEERESVHFVPETIHVFVRCPGCGSNDFSITEGRGIFVGD